jgi:predicted nucleic acid-binding protein
MEAIGAELVAVKEALDRLSDKTAWLRWLKEHVHYGYTGHDAHMKTTGYFDVLKGVLSGTRAAGALVHDARSAALCLHHGVRELWTADRDFSRFAALRTRNPLVGREA